MASCDDDFTLLGDDNAVTTASNTNPNYHNQQAFSNKYRSTTDDDVVSADGEGYSDVAINNNTSSYHIVSVNPYGNNSDPYGADPDPNRIRVNTSTEKRTDREEVSDNGTPYCYKKAKVSSSSGGGGGDYRKDREEWSDTAIACLLEAYMEKFMQLNRGNLRGRDWEEVALMVSERCEKQRKSVEQCKNKVDNLKKRYKLERHRLNNGGISASHWPWFKQMDQIIGNSPSATKAPVNEEKATGGGGGGGGGSTNSTRQSKRYLATTSNGSGQINNNNNVKAKTSIPNPRWRRVVFKISGAALSGSDPHNIDPKVALLIAREVSIACRLGVEVAIVVGGRNFFCGDTWVNATGLDRSTAYQIGMMATVMNSILLQSALEKLGVETRLQSTFSMPEVAEPYSRQRAIRHLEKGRVVIFGGIGAGTGNPLFSTDTAAALRASEIQADALLKGTNIDGVYVHDSRNNNVIAEHISFRDLSSRGASSMDMMALTYCQENGLPVVIFNLLEPGNISRALSGEQVGTLIDQTGSAS